MKRLRRSLAVLLSFVILWVDGPLPAFASSLATGPAARAKQAPPILQLSTLVGAPVGPVIFPPGQTLAASPKTPFAPAASPKADIKSAIPARAIKAAPAAAASPAQVITAVKKALDADPAQAIASAPAESSVGASENVLSAMQGAAAIERPELPEAAEPSRLGSSLPTLAPARSRLGARKGIVVPGVRSPKTSGFKNRAKAILISALLTLPLMSAFAPRADASPEGQAPPVAAAQAESPITLVSQGPQGEVRSDAQHFDSDAASVDVKVTPTEVRVRFTPKAGYHLYLPGSADGIPIGVEGTSVGNITFGPAQFPKTAATETHAPVEVVMSWTGNPGATPAKLKITWQGCNDTSCDPPQTQELALAEKNSTATPVPTTPTATPQTGQPSSGLMFEAVGTAQKSLVETLWDKMGLLILGPLFLAGLLLALTPCVLPMIPVTVGIIAGGRADLSRGRKAALLGAFAGGLALSFGVMGVAAALTGVSFSAVFQSPWAVGGIATLFGALSLGMFGLFNVQPSGKMGRLMDKLSSKGGSIPRSLILGAVFALLASPCTGPVIIGMLLFMAQGGSILTGFLMFLALGLGMGSVFFAAGSLNLLMRPGPWMEWVKYGFGATMLGGALYYLASAGLISLTGVVGLGAAAAVLVGAGVARTLHKKMAEPIRSAIKTGAKVALMILAVTGLVGAATHHSDAPITAPIPGIGSVQKEDWIVLKDRAQLWQEVQRAQALGRPVIVDVWATWCNHCREYDNVMASDPRLREGLSKMVRLRIDVTNNPHQDLRDALGIPASQQPFIVFINAKGQIERGKDLGGFDGADKATAQIQERLEALGVLAPAPGK